MTLFTKVSAVKKQR